MFVDDVRNPKSAASMYNHNPVFSDYNNKTPKTKRLKAVSGSSTPPSKSGSGKVQVPLDAHAELLCSFALGAGNKENADQAQQNPCDTQTQQYQSPEQSRPPEPYQPLHQQHQQQQQQQSHQPSCSPHMQHRHRTHSPPRSEETERKTVSAFRKYKAPSASSPTNPTTINKMARKSPYPVLHYRNFTVKTLRSSEVKNLPSHLKVVLSVKFA